MLGQQAFSGLVLTCVCFFEEESQRLKEGSGPKDVKEKAIVQFILFGHGGWVEWPYNEMAAVSKSGLLVDSRLQVRAIEAGSSCSIRCCHEVAKAQGR